MATTTTKLGLKKPTAADYFNIADFNGNMDKIDALTHIVAAGSTTTNKYEINSDTKPGGNVMWRWKKYSNGTFTACTFTTTTNLRCNESGGEDGTWNSGYLRMDLPALGIATIYNVQVSVRSTERNNWATDWTGAENTTSVAVRLVGLKNEGSVEEKSKRIYVQVDGEWK